MTLGPLVPLSALVCVLGPVASGRAVADGRDRSSLSSGWARRSFRLMLPWRYQLQSCKTITIWLALSVIASLAVLLATPAPSRALLGTEPPTPPPAWTASIHEYPVPVPAGTFVSQLNQITKGPDGNPVGGGVERRRTEQCWRDRSDLNVRVGDPVHFSCDPEHALRDHDRPGRRPVVHR